MTTPRMIYLIGPPGSGKSELMAKLTDPFERRPAAIAPDGVAHDWLIREVPGSESVYPNAPLTEIVGAEIGIRRELFSGTDALPSSIIERAIPWIETRPYSLLLAEGARLANKRFLYAALNAGYHVTLALLDHSDSDGWRKRRAKLIGREQNPSWVKGRISASRNLAAEFMGKMAADENLPVKVLIGHPDELYPQLAALLG